MLLHTQGNQWRQLGRVYGWLIISQMSQLDKQHTQDQKASERQGYLEPRSPKSWSRTLEDHSILPMGAAGQLGGWRELRSGLVKPSQQCVNGQWTDGPNKDVSGSQEVPRTAGDDTLTLSSGGHSSPDLGCSPRRLPTGLSLWRGSWVPARTTGLGGSSRIRKWKAHGIRV